MFVNDVICQFPINSVPNCKNKQAFSWIKRKTSPAEWCNRFNNPMNGKWKNANESRLQSHQNIWPPRLFRTVLIHHVRAKLFCLHSSRRARSKHGLDSWTFFFEETLDHLLVGNEPWIPMASRDTRQHYNFIFKSKSLYWNKFLEKIEGGGDLIVTRVTSTITEFYVHWDLLPTFYLLIQSFLHCF